MTTMKTTEMASAMTRKKWNGDENGDDDDDDDDDEEEEDETMKMMRRSSGGRRGEAWGSIPTEDDAQMGFRGLRDFMR